MANDRITQLPIEVVVSPTDSKARITQEPIEVVYVGAPAARMTQMPIEVVVQNVQEDVNVFLIA